MLEHSRARDSAGATRADRTMTKKAQNPTANGRPGRGCGGAKGLCQLGFEDVFGSGPIFAFELR